ncbi:HPP-domain-containing protein [Sporormia fimetaria CBS 119925]|uniref:HPP-domain-containing protein n=1 Tax=Sporormia fimetaria CBS 119925 TaxID=1340428 RepID=A0A6A6VKH3_9PLEO|nr:HPP-domain-containing protein [Sporormia fimetaria CBS 119925]
MHISDPLIPVERRTQQLLSRLPTWFSRWLGYRGKKLGPSPTPIVCLWGFIGAFCGLSILFAVFAHTDYFTSRLVPPIVASFGASAILIYGAIDVPLAQPRSLIFGHFLSALTGVIMATIFDLNLERNAKPSLQWLAASLSTAIALIVMHVTKTTHPPAGATALMPCVDPVIWALRWYFLAVVLLSSTLVLVVALLVNNIQRQYPKFWFAQVPPPAASPPPAQKEKSASPLPVSNGDANGQPKEHILSDLEAGAIRT